MGSTITKLSVADIAFGLTRAQRRVIIDDDVAGTRGDRTIRVQLQRQGLYDDDFALTVLGRQVQAHLIGNE